MDDVSTIAEQIEADIRRLETGARLPSEHMLMSRFGATRSVVRRAIERLEQRYLVRRSQGAGTFVNRRIDYVISSRNSPSLHATVEKAGSTARTFVVDADLVPAPDRVAERLGIPQGTELTKLGRVGYIDDEPATFGEEWIAPGVVPHAAVGLRAIESLTEVLRSARRDPVRAWSRVATEFATEEVERRLDLRASGALWRIETLTTDGREGEPLMYSRSWQRPDRVRVVIEFAATP
jgi:DNA-binding GntR family transcriptional regulator